MQVPGAQNVKVQVTSEGKALVESVQDVLLLLLLMARGETCDATTVWSLPSRDSHQESESESESAFDVLFLLDGKEATLGLGLGLGRRQYGVQLCLSLTAATWGRASG